MCENVENQLRAVDDLDVNSGFEVTLLGRREFVVDDQDVGIVSFRQFLQLLDFAVSKQGGGIDDGTNLKDPGYNRCARACSQFGKLVKRFGGRGGRRTSPTFEARKDGLLRVLFE